MGPQNYLLGLEVRNHQTTNNVSGRAQNSYVACESDWL